MSLYALLGIATPARFGGSGDEKEKGLAVGLLDAADRSGLKPPAPPEVGPVVEPAGKDDVPKPLNDVGGTGGLKALVVVAAEVNPFIDEAAGNFCFASNSFWMVDR